MSEAGRQVAASRSTKPSAQRARRARAAWAVGHAHEARRVECRAAHGGAHGCAHVLARAHPRARQALRRRAVGSQAHGAPPRGLEREHSYESRHRFFRVRRNRTLPASASPGCLPRPCLPRPPPCLLPRPCLPRPPSPSSLSPASLGLLPGCLPPLCVRAGRGQS